MLFFCIYTTLRASIDAVARPRPSPEGTGMGKGGREGRMQQAQGKTQPNSQSKTPRANGKAVCTSPYGKRGFPQGEVPTTHVMGCPPPPYSGELPPFPPCKGKKNANRSGAKNVSPKPTHKKIPPYNFYMKVLKLV